VLGRKTHPNPATAQLFVVLCCILCGALKYADTHTLTSWHSLTRTQTQKPSCSLQC